MVDPQRNKSNIRIHPGGGKSVTVKGVPTKPFQPQQEPTTSTWQRSRTMKERNETAAQAIHAIHKGLKQITIFLANSVATTARANNIGSAQFLHRVHRYGETPKEAIAALRQILAAKHHANEKQRLERALRGKTARNRQGYSGRSGALNPERGGFQCPRRHQPHATD